MTGPAGPLPLPLDWARGVLAAAEGMDLPRYGSPQWHALPYDSPARLAAVVVAAEAYRYEGETLAHRLRLEVEEAGIAAAAAELEDAVVQGAEQAMARDEALAEHARKVADRGARILLGRSPTYAQLAERRGEPDRQARARAHERRIAALPPLEAMMRRRTA